MRIMGLDFGDKRIGVALSDPLGWTAQGLEVIQRGASVAADIKRIKEIVDKYQVERIVLGLPKNMDGSPGPAAEKVKSFAGNLAGVLKIPVDFWDERLSTVAAEKLLIEADMSRARRRKVVDKMAAVMILQGYLDSPKNDPAKSGE
ncbi:MAG: Holliday junction resolvase RuvX [Firmicutes bacterium]|nr:Holliday junction resolvase RuvX [Bacillota bacterium]